MRGRDLAILVLDQVQMLDQEIAPPRPVAEQQLDLMRGGRIDLAALRRRLGPLPSLARVLERADLVHVMVVIERPVLGCQPCHSSLWHARCQEKIQRSNKHLRGMQLRCHAPCFNADPEAKFSGLVHAVFDVEPAVVAGQALRFTSARQALSLGLLALHLAFMSFSFSIVSFILDGLAVAERGGGRRRCRRGRFGPKHV